MEILLAYRGRMATIGEAIIVVQVGYGAQMQIMEMRQAADGARRQLI